MNVTPYSLLVSVAAFAAVLVLIPPAVKLARRLGFVDQPGGRKQHKEAIAPIGGIVIFPVYMIATLLVERDLSAAWPLFTGLTLILLMGAVDDYRHIRPWIKFAVQVLAACITVIFGHAQLAHLGHLFGFGKVWLGFMAVPFSITATVLLINAVNLMDGLDGLAAGKSFIVFFWFALACAIAGAWEYFAALGPLLAVLAAFLIYNMRHPYRQRACIFLGDAGSMALGLAIAWFSIRLAQGPGPVLPPIAVAWILALPIIDICAQFYRRVREGRHPFSPDRGHFHHHFKHAGIETVHTVPLILLLAFLLGAVGLGGYMLGVPEWVLTAFWILLLFLHMALSRKPEIYIRFLSRYFGVAGSGGGA